ncbi:hypothetical protein SBD_7792 [Streptomyces bottropensis ATCC 25435]|uniref:Uncharacterized protein n=1 Tax=Streptomyces bottropensis ATCC 25435 TaxID=1054862 RepID=M3FE05_9ACTN|nr:hypothetical protein SBD_7792 [Streptomyces bottropensis ATCC 25435]
MPDGLAYIGWGSTVAAPITAASGYRSRGAAARSHTGQSSPMFLSAGSTIPQS